MTILQELTAEDSKNMVPKLEANCFPSDDVNSARESIVPSRKSLLLATNTVIGDAPGDKADFTPFMNTIIRNKKTEVKKMFLLANHFEVDCRDSRLAILLTNITAAASSYYQETIWKDHMNQESSEYGCILTYFEFISI